MAPVGLTAGARWVIGGVVLVLVAGTVPLVLDVPDVTDTMDRGRVGGPAWPRRGSQRRRWSTARARSSGARPSISTQASDQLQVGEVRGGRVVPGVAPNLRGGACARRHRVRPRAQRRGGDVGRRSRRHLTVVDGTIPHRRGAARHPALVQGADTLERSLARLEDVADEPYLLGPVRDAVATVRKELARGAREARNTAAAVRARPRDLRRRRRGASLPPRGAEPGREPRHRRSDRLVRDPHRATTATSTSAGSLRTGVWNATTGSRRRPRLHRAAPTT